MKILIVDDDCEIVEIMEYLISSKYPPETVIKLAYSGNEAIKILDLDHQIDICICDHNMLNGMGYDVLKHIADSKLKTKFVLCSTVVPKDKPLEYPEHLVFFNIQKPNLAYGIDCLFKLS